MAMTHICLFKSSFHIHSLFLTILTNVNLALLEFWIISSIKKHDLLKNKPYLQ